MAQVNVDSLLLHAIDLSHSVSTSDEAIEELELVLELAPEYNDARVHLARVLGWNHKNDRAISVIEEAIGRDSVNFEAWIVYIDLLRWDYQSAKAEEKAAYALTLIDNLSPEQINQLKLKRAEALISQKKIDEAQEILEEVGTMGEDLLASLYYIQWRDYVDLRGTTERFSDVFDPMYYSSLEFRHRPFEKHTFVGRINTAQRFNEWGTQGEIDYYPVFSRRWSAYINYGYSPTPSVFPEHRIGGDLYYAFGRGLFRASAGLRYLYFAPGNDVTIYTAGLALTRGYQELTLRTFITPLEDGNNFAWNIFYQGNISKRHYLNANITFGFSPDPRRIQVGSGQDIAILENRQLTAEWRYRFHFNWETVAGFAYTFQERPSVENSFYEIYAPTIGLRYSF